MITYKIDVIACLKECGYNTGRLRREKLLTEGILQNLRHRRPISFQSLNKLCRLLDCQSGDILEYYHD